MNMDRALYLRPDAIRGTGFDDCVKEWLRKEDFEPVDDGDFDAVVFVPYDGAATTTTPRSRRRCP